MVAPGGRLLLAFRRNGEGGGLDPHARGASDAEVDAIRRLLAACGFADVRWSEHKRKREIVTILTAS